MVSTNCCCFIIMENKCTRKKIGDFVWFTIPYLMLTVIWQITFVGCMKNKLFQNDKYGFYKTIGVSITVWLVFAFIFYKLKVQSFFNELKLTQ